MIKSTKKSLYDKKKTKKQILVTLPALRFYTHLPTLYFNKNIFFNSDSDGSLGGAAKTYSEDMLNLRLRLCEIVMFTKHPQFNLPHFRNVLNKKSTIQHYAYILHDKDKYDQFDLDNGLLERGKKIGDLKDPHYHFVLRLKSNYTIAIISNWFNIPPNAIATIKGRFTDALTYLTHRNYPSRYQYHDGEVISNFNWANEIIRANLRKYRLDPRGHEIIQKIQNKEIICKYIYNYLTDAEIYRYQKEIDFGEKLLNLKALAVHTRNLSTIFIQGASNLCKTSFSKYLALQKGLDFYVCDEGKDFLNNYRLEPCIILNDKTHEDIPVRMYLNLLDPYTSTAVASRYYNKHLQCQLIIITTTLSMEEYFYNPEFSQERNQIDFIQYQRRCQTYIQFRKDYIHIYQWDNLQLCYFETEIIPNNFFHLMTIYKEKFPQQPVSKSVSQILQDKKNMENYIKELFKKQQKLKPDN